MIPFLQWEEACDLDPLVSWVKYSRFGVHTRPETIPTVDWSKLKLLKSWTTSQRPPMLKPAGSGFDKAPRILRGARRTWQPTETRLAKTTRRTLENQVQGSLEMVQAHAVHHKTPVLCRRELINIISSPNKHAPWYFDAKWQGLVGETIEFSQVHPDIALSWHVLGGTSSL